MIGISNENELQKVYWIGNTARLYSTRLWRGSIDCFRPTKLQSLSVSVARLFNLMFDMSQLGSYLLNILMD